MDKLVWLAKIDNCNRTNMSIEAGPKIKSPLNQLFVRF